MSKTIYIGTYATKNSQRQRSPAAQTLMEYVAEVIGDSCEKLTIFSTAQHRDIRIKNVTIEHINENIEVVFAQSFKIYKKNLVMRAIQKIRRTRSFYKDLLKLVEDGDTVILYHTPALMKCMKKIRKKKKINFILQVCEIYADVSGSRYQRKREIEHIKSADAYIFSSSLLEQKLNSENKKFTICCGTYKLENQLNTPNDDGKIHVLYAGTFDPTKGGVYSAVQCAEYLDDRYHLHILGFGSEQQKKAVKDLVKEVGSKTKCGVSYDGCILGEDYIKFLQSCHIGLSTQNPAGDYNATSFPSKILSYLSNGLRVVSIKIPAVETSPVSDAIAYYGESHPENIANAIKAIDINDSFMSRNLIKQLDSQFRMEIIETIQMG